LREILKETIDGKSGICLLILWDSFFQLIAEKATANFFKLIVGLSNVIQRSPCGCGACLGLGVNAVKPLHYVLPLELQKINWAEILS
jgi:hypothetical protein